MRNISPFHNALFVKAPQKPHQWDDVKDCTQEKSECLQRDPYNKDKITGSEDCLYLNVYTPKVIILFLRILARTKKNY